MPGGGYGAIDDVDDDGTWVVVVVVAVAVGGKLTLRGTGRCHGEGTDEAKAAAWVSNESCATTTLTTGSVSSSSSIGMASSAVRPDGQGRFKGDVARVVTIGVVRFPR